MAGRAFSFDLLERGVDAMPPEHHMRDLPVTAPGSSELKTDQSEGARSAQARPG